MAIVHHSNYLCFFEEARVVFLEEHLEPYTAFMELGLNFAVTQAHVEYQRSARFDDRLQIITWVSWVRGASLGMAYRVMRGEEQLAEGHTEHAAVNSEGRVRRIPRGWRDTLRAAMGGGSSGTAG